jgi:hypothetical protein
MREEVRNNCKLFVENYYELRKSIKWNNATNARIGALLYALEGKEADADAINRCRKIISDNTSTISQFKDITNFISSVMLSFHSNQEEMFKSVLQVYRDMKKEGFHSSPYLVLAAFAVVLEAKSENYQRIIKSARSYYNAMKSEHRFITGSNDYCYSVLLAMNDKPSENNLIEMENCFTKLSETFTHSDAIQSLSHIMTLSDEATESKCKKAEELYQALRKRKCGFGLGSELSFIGVSILLTEDIEKLADEITEVSNYLTQNRGFGKWYLINKERIMYAIAIVYGSYLGTAEKKTMEMILANNITGIIRAQQVATVTAAT